MIRKMFNKFKSALSGGGKVIGGQLAERPLIPAEPPKAVATKTISRRTKCTNRTPSARARKSKRKAVRRARRITMLRAA